MLHGEVPDPAGDRLACVCVPLTPAVVIGSAQPASDFDDERLGAAGLELVRRRSGGGAVLVAPGRQVWLDVFVPTADALSQPDVGRSFYWLGDVFANAIASVLGASNNSALIEVKRGPTPTSPWSKVLCFAALGAGEVTVAGRKVVGMSQRRERAGSWIHAMALLGGRGADLAEMLSGTPDRRSQARAVLAEAGLPEAEHLIGPLTDELLSRLP
jgi:lipoate-protein ligase A